MMTAAGQGADCETALDEAFALLRWLPRDLIKQPQSTSEERLETSRGSMGSVTVNFSSLRVWAIDVSEHAALRVPSSGAGGELIKRAAEVLLPCEEAVAVGKYIRAIDRARRYTV